MYLIINNLQGEKLCSKELKSFLQVSQKLKQ